MKILIFGGTGSMGKPLTTILAEQNNEVYVTSRTEHKNQYKNVHYIIGNAHDNDFIKVILNKHFDAIIDFMAYTTDEFKNRIKLLLKDGGQYFFLSSCRVYADSGKMLNENSVRLLDTIDDEEYLKTDEYALAKAKQEDILFRQNEKNWTIIRPYITYNSERLQLGVYEKEQWLYRALRGRTIVFQKDIAENTTQLTYGTDVAKAIVSLIGNPKAFGECFQIIGSEKVKWEDVLKIYVQAIEQKTGKKVNTILTDDQKYNHMLIFNSYQYHYDRAYNRCFDTSKIHKVFSAPLHFTDIQHGLAECIDEFLTDPKFKGISWKSEAAMDRICGERTPLSEIHGWKNKVIYLLARYTDYYAKKD